MEKDTDVSGVRQQPADAAPAVPAFGSVLRRLNPYDLATAALVLALAVLVLATFRDYAISNDEEVQHRYGELIVRYYVSGFADRSVFSFENLYLYGGLFDVASILIGHVLPFDVFHIRHVLCGLIGVGGIAATAATARLIAGPRAGLIAAVLLASFGLWYGGMFNHTKDIPFATGMILATFFLLRACRDLPRPSRRDVVLFGLALGLALGQRVTGLLLPIYLAVAIGVLAVRPDLRSLRQRVEEGCRSLAAFAPGLLIGYTLMIAFWPWSALDLFNPVRALFAFADFHYPISTVLAGHVYEMDKVPRWYVPAYLLIKLPLIAWLGVALAGVIVTLPQLAQRAGVAASRRAEVALIAFTAIFPVLCQVAGHGPAFTGMRHFLFVAPPLVVLAAVGLDAALTLLASWRSAAAAVAVVFFAAVTAWDAATLLRLHPDEYLEYNELVGGLPGAAGRYATDYWVNIMPEAVADLQTYLDGSNTSSPWPTKARYDVGVCGESLPFDKTKAVDMHLTDDWDKADFFIAPTHMHCDAVMNGPVIARIERLGVTIGVVKDIRANRFAKAKQASFETPLP